MKIFSPMAKRIWYVVLGIQVTMGFTMGLYIFTYGPLFYDKFLAFGNPQTAITLTTFLMGVVMALTAILEVPTGAIADAIGRKRIIIWSFTCRMLFFIFLALIPFASSLGLTTLLGLLAMAAFSLSYTFFSGTFTAWCVDSLREKASGIGYEHLLSRGYTYNFLSKVVGGVCGVLLYVHGIPYVGFLVAALLCVVCVIFCLGEMEEVEHLTFARREASFTVITRRIGEIIGISFQVFGRSPAILSLVSMFACYMAVLNIVDYLWPVYLKSVALPEKQTSYWIGLVISTQLMSASGSHVLSLIARFTSKRGGLRTSNTRLRRLLFIACLMTVLPILFLSWGTLKNHQMLWPLALAIIATRFAYGIVAPCFETLVNNFMPEENAQHRATIMSFGSFVRCLLVMLLAIPSGGSSGETTTIWWAIPALLLLVVALVGNRTLRRSQNTKVCETHKLTPEN